ncbi:MAG: hypothetical protein JWM80_825 [Cyanobacteria bacterium RYN_339]|nr:hypothetical protein [Cyanobacteria bacterium RYN_339]
MSQFIVALRNIDLEPIRYSLMCGGLISTVTLLMVLPGTWDLPWLLADGYALTHGGVHVDVPLEGRETTYGSSTYKGKTTRRPIPVLVLRPPGGAQARVPVSREEADLASRSGRVPLVHLPGAPDRFRLEGHAWDGIGWRLAMIGLIGLSPLLFGLFLSVLHVAQHLRTVWRRT